MFSRSSILGPTHSLEIIILVCYSSVKNTTTLFAFSDHDILSQEWRVIVDKVQAKDQLSWYV